jgi:hypothetical protein
MKLKKKNKIYIKKMLTRVNSFNSWSRLSNHKYYTWKYHETQFQTNQILNDEIGKKNHSHKWI